MKLYHGTSVIAAQNAVKEGLKPRMNQKGNWASPGKVKSIPSMVYLTAHVSQAQFYGLRAAVCQNQTEYAILECDVDIDKLFPDENLFVEYDRNGHVFADGMRKAKTQVRKNKDGWKRCLETRGIVCHRGAIPSTQISIHLNEGVKKNKWGLFANQTQTIEEFDNKYHYWVWGSANGYFNSSKIDLVEMKWDSPYVHVYFDKTLIITGNELPTVNA